MPGRKRNREALKRAALLCAALAAVFVLMPDAAARPKRRDNSNAYRVRLSLPWGLISYDSFSEASNGRTTFSAYPSLAYRGEVEHWVPVFTDPWPIFGFHAEAETYPVRLLGRVLRYSEAFVSAAWRVTGQVGQHWDLNEFVLMAGADLQSFPDARGYAATKGLDVYQPLLNGLRLDARWRLGIDKRKRWRADLGIHYIIPMGVHRASSVNLGSDTTRSLGTDTFLEYNLSPDVDLGFGALYENNRIEYRPVASEGVQDIHWTNVAPLIFIQFWF